MKESEKIYESILEKLEGVNETGSGHSALCPAHDDHNPSLSLKLTGDRILLNCFAGCKPNEVLNAIGFW